MVNLFPHSAEDTSPRAKASWTSPFWNVEKRVRCRPAELNFMVRLKFQEKHCLASAISQRHIFSLKGPRVLIVGLFYGPAGGQSRGQRGCTWDRFKFVIITEEAAHLFHLMTTITFLFPLVLTHSSPSLLLLPLLTWSRHRAFHLYVSPTPLFLAIHVRTDVLNAL